MFQLDDKEAVGATWDSENLSRTRGDYSILFLVNTNPWEKGVFEWILTGSWFLGMSDLIHFSFLPFHFPRAPLAGRNVLAYLSMENLEDIFPKEQLCK